MPILSSLLAPYRAYLIAGLLVLALVGVGRFAAHERSVEHAKDVAVATKAVAKVEKQDAIITSDASTRVQHDQLIYKQVVSMPAVGDLGVVCRASGGDTMPGAAGSADGGDRSNTRSVGSAFDPTGEALTVGRDADAKIMALQHIIADLRTEMEAARKAHR